MTEKERKAVMSSKGVGSIRSVSSILDARPVSVKEHDIIPDLPESLPEAAPEVPRFETRGRPRKSREGDSKVRVNWDSSKSYTTSFVFDLDQYNEIEDISYAQRLSKKATVKALLELGLAEYHKKGTLG